MMSFTYSELQPHIPIAFCASYIDDERRIQPLINSIDSWTEQTLPCPLFLSISIDDCSLREKIVDILTSIDSACKTSDLVFSFQIHNEKKSQFENYKSLVDEFRTSYKDSWVVFSDDDDIWHPERIKTYTQVCYEIDKKHSHIDNIDCAVYAESADPSLDVLMKTPEHVEALIKCGKAKIVKGSNYVTNCVRFERLASFVDKSSKELLACPFADVRFKAFLTSDGHSSGKQHVIVTPPLDTTWMYYYRASDSSVTSTSNKFQTPHCVTQSEGLYSKWRRFTDTMSKDDINRMKSLLNNLLLLICSNVKKEDLKRENERMLLGRGISPKCIVSDYRSLYGILDDFMSDEYFKKLTD